MLKIHAKLLPSRQDELMLVAVIPELIGTTNGGAWEGWQAGEVAMLGVDYHRDAGREVVVSFDPFPPGMTSARRGDWKLLDRLLERPGLAFVPQGSERVEQLVPSCTWAVGQIVTLADGRQGVVEQLAAVAGGERAIVVLRGQVAIPAGVSGGPAWVGIRGPSWPRCFASNMQGLWLMTADDSGTVFDVGARLDGKASHTVAELEQFCQMGQAREITANELLHRLTANGWGSMALAVEAHLRVHFPTLPIQPYGGHAARSTAP
jgi:hypothetical protein